MMFELNSITWVNLFTIWIMHVLTILALVFTGA
jgi:hypothetical protein